ncbi:hypothetical protein CRG98_020349 [Punica granatum]|uniref:DC1 domain-containing protein n=1 Tax=Punica granatum TaxID=22663 RepID=A0A2I0JSH2_PUNGR|nr:hypothetical protein CRG98_020349 [Punica granatum]
MNNIDKVIQGVNYEGRSYTCDCEDVHAGTEVYFGCRATSMSSKVAFFTAILEPLRRSNVHPCHLQLIILVLLYCAERQLATQIDHPLHPPHTLILDPRLCGSGWTEYHCSRCQKKYYLQFSYCCSKCDYDLDLECAALVPTLKLRDPSYLHSLFEKVGFSGDSRCSVCVNDSKINSPTFVCMIPQCVHDLHLHCAPVSTTWSVQNQWSKEGIGMFTTVMPVRRKEIPSFRSITARNAILLLTSSAAFPRSAPCCDSPSLVGYVMNLDVMAISLYELPSLIKANESDCLQRGASLEALLRYYEDELPRLLSEKEEKETKMKEIQQEIEALEEERIFYIVSNLLG